MTRKRRLTALFGVLVVAFTAALLAIPANAASGTVICTGWTHATYAPGLTDTAKPTTVTVDGALNVINEHSPTGSCLALGSSATAGERHVTAQLDVGCTQLITETGVETINWNDGRSTSFTFSANVTRGLANSVLLETGTVTSGEFAGDSVVETFTAANTALLDCATPGGVTSLDFATVLTITL